MGRHSVLARACSFRKNENKLQKVAFLPPLATLVRRMPRGCRARHSRRRGSAQMVFNFFKNRRDNFKIHLAAALENRSKQVISRALTAACIDGRLHGRPPRTDGPKTSTRPPPKPPQGRPKMLHKVAPKCSTRSPQKPPKGRPKMLHKIAPGGSACPAHAEAAIHASGHQCTRPSMHARRRMNNRPQPGGEVNLKITTPIFIFFNNF